MSRVIGADDSPLLRLLVHTEADVPEGVDTRVSTDDEMLCYAVDCHGGDRAQGLASYFLTGLSIYRVWRQILDWRYGGLERVSSLLDFAAGHGRVTRFFAAALPSDALVVADVDAAALEFQRRTFGAATVPSRHTPRTFDAGRRFAAVVVTSLFTHLPEHRFSAWLASLWRHVAPGGILVLTTHDTTLLSGDDPGRASDFHFLPASESRWLTPDEYGSTWVSGEFLRRRLAELPGTPSIHRIHRGLTSFHDLTVVVREEDVDFSDLHIAHELGGRLESCEVAHEDRLSLSGWAADAEGFGPPTVTVSLGAESVAAVTASGSRPDVAEEFEGHFGEGFGWQCRVVVDGPGFDGTTPLVVRLEADDGRRRAIFAGTLHSALLASARQREISLERRLENARDRIDWMESSRFWTLRNRWFAVKRALGLTEED